MKNIIRTFIVLVASLGLVSVTNLAVSQPVSAINVIKGSCTGSNASTSICKGSDDSIDPLIRTIIRVLLIILGSIAVIMIIVGGLKYTLSNGDSAQITSAKNTILYAIVGLVVALLSYAIVEFVVGRF